MRTRLLIPSLLALALLPGCATLVSEQGHRISKTQLDKVVIGVSSREDVFRLLGSPGVVSLQKGNLWLYMWRRVETRFFLAPKETARQVTVFSFDQSGRVSNIKRLSRKDRKRIRFASAETPEIIQGSQHWLDRIINNIGRVLPGGVGGLPPSEGN